MSENKEPNINNQPIQKEDNTMSLLSEYLQENKENKEKAYKIATANTNYNSNKSATISSTDEWIKETEWDDLFSVLKNKKAEK